MGRWGTGLFDDDVAADVERDFERALDEGLGVLEATRLILTQCAPWLEDEDEGPVVLLALAALQVDYGAIQPQLRDQALGILMTGAGMELWEEDGPPGLLERQQVLDQFRQRLSTLPASQVTDQFPPLQRPPRPPEQPVAPGDFVSIPLKDGRLGFGRVLLYGIFGAYDLISEQPLASSSLHGRPFLFRVLLDPHAITSWRWLVIGQQDLDAAEIEQANIVFGDAVHRRIYHQGQWRQATVEECQGLEYPLWYDAQWVECHLVRMLLEDTSGRKHHMADTQALRPLVQAATQQQAEQQQRQEAYQRTPAYREERMAAFQTRLETVLTPPVRQALDLLYEWDEWTQQPRAVFRLESLQGTADCTLHYSEAHRIWSVFLPNPSRPHSGFESQDLEQGLLVTIGEFWKGQGRQSSPASPHKQESS
jgi:hypothetical protein